MRFGNGVRSVVAVALWLICADTVEAQCEADADCAEGESCHVSGAPAAEPGAEVTDPAEASVGTCRLEGYGETCQEGEQCPDGLACQIEGCLGDDDNCAGERGFCLPPGTDVLSPDSSGSSGSGAASADEDTSGSDDCSAGGGSRGGTGIFPLLVGLLLLWRRRVTRV